MPGKRLPSSLRKHIRRKKAEIRRQSWVPAEQDSKIEELVRKIQASYSKKITVLAT